MPLGGFGRIRAPSSTMGERTEGRWRGVAQCAPSPSFRRRKEKAESARKADAQQWGADLPDKEGGESTGGWGTRGKASRAVVLVVAGRREGGASPMGGRANRWGAVSRRGGRKEEKKREMGEGRGEAQIAASPSSLGSQDFAQPKKGGRLNSFPPPPEKRPGERSAGGAMHGGGPGVARHERAKRES